MSIKRTLVTIALLAIGFFISLRYSTLLPNNQFVNAQTNQTTATQNTQVNQVGQRYDNLPNNSGASAPQGNTSLTAGGDSLSENNPSRYLLLPLPMPYTISLY